MNIAFLGTGLMGRPMAGRLLHNGHRLWVYNRTAGKAAGLVEAGAAACHAPEEALAHGDWVFTMLTDAPAIEATLLSAAARPLLAGRRVVNLGTIAPAQNRDLAARFAAAGAEFMESPVLGSVPEASAGTLIVMFGGTPAQFQQALPLLRAFGARPLHVGEVGTASTLKLAMNQLIATLTAAFSISLALARRGGVPVQTFMDVVHDSALHAPTFDKKLPRMLDGDFTRPNFPLKHLLKDVRLVEETAAGLGIDTAVPAALEKILAAAQAGGDGDLDYSALYRTIAGARD